MLSISLSICRFHKNADQVKVCAQAFYTIQAHHDYCPHDTLTRYEEELFHAWEGKCHGCSIVRKYDANLKKCPVIDCTDTSVAEVGYEHLNETCTKADTSYAFEWAASFDTPADSYKWVSQAATDDASVASGKKYVDDYMKVVAYKMNSNLKSELFGLKDLADTKMDMAGACPEVTTMATITPTAAGACVTVKFPDSSASLIDFHATVNTMNIAHVAFFTAHMPTEFERDTHYFMSTDLATDIEPVSTLGESGGHDHGRRLSAVGPNDRRSPRRLANPGACCGTTRQQGAWRQVVSYHDECHHSQVPEYIEVGFHDYEASCEDHFCNLIDEKDADGNIIDQTICPYSPPPPPSLPPTPPPPPPLPPPPSPVDNNMPYPLTYENCGVAHTLTESPKMVVTMNQGMTEFMLAMGLEGHMAGTAYLDDAIWPKYEAVYKAIPVLASGYPTDTQLMDARADFIMANYNSAFSEKPRSNTSNSGIFTNATVGPCEGTNSDFFPAGSNETMSYGRCRPQLHAAGIGTWLEPTYCEDKALQPLTATEETVYAAVTQIGEIFNVPNVATQLNAEIKSDFAIAKQTVQSTGHALTAILLDGFCGEDKNKLFVGAGQGSVNLILTASGFTNLFAAKEGSYACVDASEVIAANPDVLLIIEASWSSALSKIDHMHNHSEFCNAKFVQQADYITLPFSASALGPRNGAAALDLVGVAIHVTTGATAINFASGVSFFDPEVLVTRTAGLRCPVVLKNVQYAGSLVSASPPPPPAGSTYTFNVIAEGVLSDFDSDKVDTIKASIATMAGVSTSAVTVSVLAGSVNIVVNIKTSDTVSYGSIANKVDSYLTSASRATELLGGSSILTVTKLVSVPVPYPEESLDKDDVPSWAIGVIVVFVMLFGAVLVFAIFMRHREKQGKPVFSSLEEPALEKSGGA